MGGFPRGQMWDKHDKEVVVNDKKKKSLSYEYREDKTGVKRKTLHDTWDEFAYLIIKYITCEGRMIQVYPYHFIYLNFMRHFYTKKLEERLSVPHFLFKFTNGD